MNLWIINNVSTIKNVFTTIRVVWVSGGSRLRNRKMVSLRFSNPLISKHIKIYLVSLVFFSAPKLIN